MVVFPLKRIRLYLWIMIVGLVVSGVTAIPLETEMIWLTQLFSDPGDGAGLPGWLYQVRDALVATNRDYPFLAYGTDWLGFAHLLLAILFIGPLRDPIRNLWVIEFGMIACVLVIPFALIMGEVRGLPWGWRMIDCSFGVFGIIPLWICRKDIQRQQSLCSKPG